MRTFVFPLFLLLFAAFCALMAADKLVGFEVPQPDTDLGKSGPIKRVDHGEDMKDDCTRRGPSSISDGLYMRTEKI